MTLIIDTDAPSAIRQHLLQPPDPNLATRRVKLRDRAGLICGEAIVAAIDGNDLILTDLRELPEEDRFRSEGGVFLTAWTDAGAGTGGRRQLRPEQQEFRRRLLEAYGGRCAVTDCDVEAALEAAHLRDFRTSNEVRDGILLRADIHALLDEGLMTITPDLRAVFAPQALSHYRDFDGKPLHLPVRRRDWPQP
ncbi:HNH endonuclease [Skermanella mucosa]|uniref:HNH endonuclease n=1 Tax=Skermanella mucosa TaxID=1789672 RepID=UPI00192CDB1D|nr:HNH endonuclease signature motif containing protein [Skermanella mucosa]UEM19690.1 HNH endonuclease [Skermanella mucosa]